MAGGTRATIATVEEFYATAKDLARLYGVAVGTIHSWASADAWKRKNVWPRQYSWSDAQASWERRHPGDWAHYAARPDE